MLFFKNINMILYNKFNKKKWELLVLKGLVGREGMFLASPADVY